MIIALAVFVMLGILIGSLFRLRELIASLIVAAIVVAGAMVVQQRDLPVILGAALAAVIAMQVGFFLGLLLLAAIRATTGRRSPLPAEKANGGAPEDGVHHRLGDGPG